jgi:hypothetical protein
LFKGTWASEGPGLDTEILLSLEKKEILTSVTAQMNLEDTLLSGISQVQKDRNPKISPHVGLKGQIQKNREQRVEQCLP